MEKFKEVLLKDENIPVPEEFKSLIRPGTKVVMRMERFGMIIQPKVDPVEDIIGCVHLKKHVNIEKQLDERFEEYGSEVY